MNGKGLRVLMTLWSVTRCTFAKNKLKQDRFEGGPYKRTQIVAHRCLLRRRHSTQGAAVHEGKKESLVYCSSGTAAAMAAVAELQYTREIKSLSPYCGSSTAAPQLAVVGKI